MASKSKIRKNQSEVEGRIIDLQRFAYDVFSYSALKFDIPESCIRRWEGEENDYGCSDFILVLSRIFLKYQITQRNLWHSSFKSRYGSNKFESFENIRQILQQVLQLSIKKASGCVLHEVVISLSVINEIIIFLYSEDCNLYLKELARFWLLYLAPIKQKFEKAGGLAELYKIYNMPKYDSVDVFYNEFIPGFCFPYDDARVLSCLDDIFHVESDRYFRELSEDLPENERFEYYLVMHKTVWRDSKHLIVSQHRKRVNMALEATARVKASGIDIPENTGLGIPQHEEMLPDAGVSVDADATLLQNLPGASCQEPARECRGSSSQDKRQKWKSDSRSRVEKDFGKLNLDSSESKHSTQKKK